MGLLMIVVASMGILSGCSAIGRQPGQLWSVQFTPDGSCLAYTYSEVFVWSYERKGNSSVSHGTAKYYMDMRDAATGRRLFAKPLRMEGAPKIIGISGDLCVVKLYQPSANTSSLCVVDLGKGKVRYNGDDLLRINHNLKLVPDNQFLNPGPKPGFIFAGEDARTYFLDPGTGRAEPSEAREQVHAVFRSRNVDQLDADGMNIRFTTGARRKLELNDHASVVDFIEPQLAGAVKEEAAERVPVLVNGGPVVLAHSSTVHDFNWEVTLLDSASLEPLWSATVVNAPDAAPFFQTEPLFQLMGNRLSMVTSTSLSSFDAGTGVLQWSEAMP